MALPVDIALPLAIVCALLLEIPCTWLLYWLYRLYRFYCFVSVCSDQYNLDHPSIFEGMRERERLFDDFDTSIAGDPMLMELERAYSWPHKLYQRIVRLVRICRRKFALLCYLVEQPDVYRRYLRHLRFNRKKHAWPQRTLLLANMVLLMCAWALLDWKDACYCRYRNIRYLWLHPQLRIRYLRRKRYRKQHARTRGYKRWL